MPSPLTIYTTTYDLTEFDIRNMEFLAEHTGQQKGTALYQALFFCQMSLQNARQGKHTSIFYKRGGARGTTASITHGSVASAYNGRPKNAQLVKLIINRSTDALQAIHDIKTAVKASSDSVAVAYALEYSATCVKRMLDCNGGKNARIFFSYSNDADAGGTVLNKHPFDLTLGNKFRKAGRRMKFAAAKLNPLKKKPVEFPEEKAPAPAAPPAPEKPAAPAADEAAKKAVEMEIDQITNGICEPIQAMRPMTFKKRGGFTL